MAVIMIVITIIVAFDDYDVLNPNRNSQTCRRPLVIRESLGRLLPVAIVVTATVPPHHPNVVHPNRYRRRRLTPAFVLWLSSTRSCFHGHHRL